MSPTHNGSTVFQHFERGNVIEIHNGTMFDFYPGLPHMGNNFHVNVQLYKPQEVVSCKLAFT